MISITDVLSLMIAFGTLVVAIIAAGREDR
ncbi:putative holin-like toxin [Camelliibacillus cellulosilyticus]|uniref:Holin-like toxin n=1 Tax=Camelliibacillus cellulosilyticus TaxID=2174486 RepID=A0ABV9GGX1_9BACL